MRKSIDIAICACVLLSAGYRLNAQSLKTQNRSNSLTINLTDAKKIHTREIGGNLILRIIKDGSVKNKDFGWIVEVVRKHRRRTSENLIYQNKTGNTADLSQVYAWHVFDENFPNFRQLLVRNSRRKITIALLDPKARGRGPDAKFTGGKLRITW